MKMWDVIGGTPQWQRTRVGMATASEFKKIITPKTLKLSSMAGTYANTVAAERILGREIVTFGGNYYTEKGHELEPEAIKMYEMQKDVECHHIGFISNDAETVGCSPDALVGCDVGVELKCPEAHTHMGYYFAGVLPDIYKMQVQLSLYITGFKRWDFISYHPELNPLFVEVFSDLELHEKMETAIETFEEMVQARIDKMGLPLAKRAKFVERRPPETEPCACQKED